MPVHASVQTLHGRADRGGRGGVRSSVTQEKGPLRSRAQEATNAPLFSGSFMCEGRRKSQNKAGTLVCLLCGCQITAGLIISSNRASEVVKGCSCRLSPPQLSASTFLKWMNLLYHNKQQQTLAFTYYLPQPSLHTTYLINFSHVHTAGEFTMPQGYRTQNTRSLEPLMLEDNNNN